MKSDTAPEALTAKSFLKGLHYLSEKDPDLAQIWSRSDPPALWAREPGFASLVYIILEQQVSLASARAAYTRLQKAMTPFTPKRFLQLDAAALKAIGFSRQKMNYGRSLAAALASGQLDLVGLASLDDTAVRSVLTRVKGIGPWTANIYLLSALRRPDIWPKEDLALAVATQEVKRLPTRPSPRELDALAADWKPWRSIAARLLWHYYLGNGSADRKKRKRGAANDKASSHRSDTR